MAGVVEIDGITRLCNAINQRAAQHAERVVTGLELDIGTIQDDWKLLTNRFPVPLEPKHYHVLRTLKGLTGKTYKKTLPLNTEDGGTVEIPAIKIKLPKLEKGDRVLVAWIRDEPIIIDVLDQMMYEEEYKEDLYDT